jgi:hypothetical protein
MDSRGGRNVIMTAALIDGMLFGEILILCLIGILGIGMGMVAGR